MDSLEKIINILEEKNQVIRIRKEVDPVYEASGLIKKIQETTNKAILFEKLKGYKHPLFSNLFGSIDRVGFILGCDKLQINNVWNSKERAAANNKIAIVEEEKGIDQYSDCKLSDMPMLKYCEKDAGKYITAGIVMVKDNETGVRNLSFHRMEFVNDEKIKLRVTPGHHLETLYKRMEACSKPLQIAILVGGHPALTLAATSRIPFQEDELKLAGAFSNHSIKVRKCKVIDMMVPMGVDFVIEGLMLPFEREEEGPFADMFGYYVPVMKNHIVEIKNVSCLKNNAHAYGILAPSCEHDVLSAVPMAASIFKNLKDIFTCIKEVSIFPPMYHSVIKIKQEYEGQAKQVGYAALSSDPGHTKFCTIVDDDVDIYNPRDVIWATITRCSPETDVLTMKGIPSFRRDPHKKFWGKMLIDATKPVAKDARIEFERVIIPNCDKINVDDYL